MLTERDIHTLESALDDIEQEFGLTRSELIKDLKSLIIKLKYMHNKQINPKYWYDFNKNFSEE